MTELIFVTGGARSGKSSFALERARELGGDDVTFVATAERSDDEMTDRIARHQLERPSAWKTIEAPREVLIADLKSRVVFLDCLSLFVSNLLLDGLEEKLILERVQIILDSRLAWDSCQNFRSVVNFVTCSGVRINLRLEPPPKPFFSSLEFP
jgi:adenosylcobinamide kinase / adenosylcobinamide-phosphate guanylyltransferase